MNGHSLMWALAAVCLLVAGCAAPAGSQATAPSGAGPARKVALLLPETKTSRYEAADRPIFQAELQRLCPDCELIYSNASQDAAAQQRQAEAALTNGARVLVLDPVDSAAAAVIADKAASQGASVISYDRLILNSAAVVAHISFDGERVGELQAQSLVDRLRDIAMPRIVMINGSPTDYNALLFKQGAHRILDPLVDAGRLTIAREYDTPDWSPDKAQMEMQQALTALANRVDAVYAANDGMASGAIAAMKAAELRPLPPVSGQDAELSAVQRILAGEQYMTVYKAIRPEAELAADAAFALLTGLPAPIQLNGERAVHNGKINVPAALFAPVVVTRENMASTVLQDGFWTIGQICTGGFVMSCQDNGLF